MAAGGDREPASEPDTVPGKLGDVGGFGSAATAVLGPEASGGPVGSGAIAVGDDSGPGGDDRYQPRELLGRGGMGEVWLAVDRRIGREIALKIATTRPGDGAALARFLREAKLQAQLDHPGIVPVHDLGTRPDGSICFTMRRIRGETLATILAGRAADDAEMLRRYTVRKLLVALVAVCHAVEAAHAHGLVHRDLKPANIMLGDRGEVYVLDWGLAKPVAEGAIVAAIDAAIGDVDPAGPTSFPADAAAAAPVADGALTAAGQFLGTPGYMAPEQARGEAIDQRVDVYALGATLFEILAATSLIPRGTAAQVIAATASGPDARASLRGHPTIPPELEELCARAAAPGLDERLTTVAALREGIEAYLDGDRDLERRRALADEAVNLATLELPRALAGDARSRAAALSALGRALALAPEHAAAQRALVELMVSPPATLPDEVDRAVLATEDATYLRLAAAGTWIFLAWLPLALIMVWMGIKQVAPLLGWVGCTVASALAMIIARARAKPGPAMFFSGLLLANTAILLASRVSGTMVLTPTLFTLNAVGFAIAARQRWLWPTLAICAVFLVAPAALEATGVFAPTTVVTGGMLQVTSTVVEFREPATSVAAIGASLAFFIMVTVAAASLRRRFLEQTRRVELALWQLRQLVPKIDRPAAGPGRATRAIKSEPPP